MTTNKTNVVALPPARQIELNPFTVERFKENTARVRRLRKETKGWSVFVEYRKDYCRKACQNYLDQQNKLCNHIEYLTKKKVCYVDDKLVCHFADGSKMKVEL